MSHSSFRGLGFQRPISLLALMAGVCGAAVMGGACTVNSTNAAADAGPGTPDGGGVPDSAKPGDGGPSNGPLAFTPSNVDLSGIDLTKVGDFVVDAEGCSVNTDNNLASCGDGAGVLGFKLATQSDGSKVGVYVAKSMTILAGKSLTVEGPNPLVFIALDTITIAGSMNVSSREEVGIAGGHTRGGEMVDRATGAGPGGGGAGTDTTASGGGSYCGIGGAGGAESGPAASGAAYGAPAISPLLAGSSGGDHGGAGGGAVQLVAGNSITIGAGGLVAAGAGGGGFGGIRTQNADGGGSGGSILLESLAVTVAGTLTANGGGGGAGTSLDVGAPPPKDPGGANATPNATPAAGGRKGIGPSSGGDGSGGASINGTAGSFTATDNNAAGGGGGGAGRIRINTKSGAAMLTGATISPPASTPCATEGKVAQ